MQHRRFPLVAPRFTVSQAEGAGRGMKTERNWRVPLPRCDGNREIALPTLIFKNAKLQEARGQIDLPRRRSVGRGEPAEGTTAKKDAPVHLRPTRPMAVDFADDRRMRHFRKPFTSNFCCNKISPTSKQSDVTHFKNKITLFYKNTFHKELLSIIIPGSY